VIIYNAAYYWNNRLKNPSPVKGTFQFHFLWLTP